jgi:hypothetical protein
MNSVEEIEPAHLDMEVLQGSTNGILLCLLTNATFIINLLSS